MATNDRVIALGSRALLAVVSLLGASLGAAAVPGNNTSVSEGRSTLGVVAAATRTKVAEQKIKTNTKLKTTGRLAPGTTNTLNPQPLPPIMAVARRKMIDAAQRRRSGGNASVICD
jgi:hypothetical protein